jgi:hypothetical protein
MWLDEADPWSTVVGARAQDPQLQALRGVLCLWETLIGTDRVTVARLIAIATARDEPESPSVDDPDFLDREFGLGAPAFRNEALREALLVVAGEGGAINSRRLGKWLAANKDRIVGGLRIAHAGESSGVAQWRLERVDAAG